MSEPVSERTGEGEKREGQGGAGRGGRRETYLFKAQRSPGLFHISTPVCSQGKRGMSTANTAKGVRESVSVYVTEW